MRHLVLASASSRRRRLLAQVGLEFEVEPSSIEEDFTSHVPALGARSLARAKARAVQARRPGAVVIGADTVVVKDGVVLGKPRDPAEAESMLRRLSGSAHQVITGVAVVDEQEEYVDHEVTTVWFRRLREEEIREYVASGEPMDKAGAYAIQGLGAVLVARIEGDYYNVVGLPLTKTVLALRRFGIEVLGGGAIPPEKRN